MRALIRHYVGVLNELEESTRKLVKNPRTKLIIWENFCAYQLIIVRPITTLNKLMLSTDIDWSIGLLIIDFHRLPPWDNHPFHPFWIYVIKFVRRFRERCEKPRDKVETRNWLNYFDFNRALCTWLFYVCITALCTNWKESTDLSLRNGLQRSYVYENKQKPPLRRY